MTDARPIADIVDEIEAILAAQHVLCSLYDTAARDILARISWRLGERTGEILRECEESHLRDEVLARVNFHEGGNDNDRI
jgi:hypothetical protein